MSPFSASPQKEEAKAALAAGMSLEECVTHFHLSPKTAQRYLDEVKNPKPPKPGKEVKSQSKPMSEGGKLATILARQPAPVVFTIGEQRIELDPEALYESHLLYEDIKVHCGLKDSFSDAIRDGVSLLWQLLVSEPHIEAGQVKAEVSHGRIPGNGEG